MAPLTRQGEFEGDWTCTVCIADKTEASRKPWASKDGDLVCVDCIKKVFSNAYSTTHWKEARWAGEVMTINEYASHLPPKFVRWAREKEREHEEVLKINLPIDTVIPPGQERGVDCQRCPSTTCGLIIELSRDCNHMTCDCGTEFCFICGEPVVGEYDHWLPGRCPRYGNYRTEMIFDAFPEELEELNEMGFNFNHWAWSVAMQTGNQRVRHALRSLLEEDYSKQPREECVGIALEAMFAFNWVHQVTEEAWTDLLDDHEDDTRATFLLDPVWDEEDASGRFGPLINGYLAFRVGGVFNIVDPIGRQEAMVWAAEKIALWSKMNAGESQHYAIFAMGPGHAQADRADAWDLLELLVELGKTLTQDRLEFHEGMNGSSVLVHVVKPPSASKLVIRSKPTGRGDPIHRLQRLFVGDRRTPILTDRMVNLREDVVSLP